MPLNASGQCWAVLRLSGGGAAAPAAKLGCVLRFTAKEIDPSTGEAEEEGYDDEYQLEGLDVAAADYVRAEPVSLQLLFFFAAAVARGGCRAGRQRDTARRGGFGKVAWCLDLERLGRRCLRRLLFCLQHPP